MGLGLGDRTDSHGAPSDSQACALSSGWPQASAFQEDRGTVGMQG